MSWSRTLVAPGPEMMSSDLSGCSGEKFLNSQHWWGVAAHSFHRFAIALCSRVLPEPWLPYEKSTGAKASLKMRP